MKARNDKVLALATLTPSLVLLAVFVYGFIGQTAYISTTDWGKGAALAVNPVIHEVGLANYHQLFTQLLDGRFRQDLINALFYSVLLIAGAIVVGLVLAIVIDRNPRGRSVYRTLFLYPMSLSFIVTGTIWRWLLAPDGGINVLPTLVGLPKIHFQWLSSDATILQFNWQYLLQWISLVAGIVVLIFAVRAWVQANRRSALPFSVAGILLLLFGIFGHEVGPTILGFKEMVGYNMATLGVIIAAVWQYSGYTMALYLAGLGGIPDQLHDSAKIDGANEFQYYMRVAIPMLKSTTLSAVIILAHISLKLFALIFAMTGPDNAQTGHPSILMYLTTFRANQFAKGAAISVVLFLFAATFVIPYLISAHRSRGK